MHPITNIKRDLFNIWLCIDPPYFNFTAYFCDFEKFRSQLTRIYVELHLLTPIDANTFASTI